MTPRQLFRMAQWARNPPSMRRIKIIFAVVGVCLVIYCIERWIGWPDWLTAQWTKAPSRVAR